MTNDPQPRSRLDEEGCVRLPEPIRESLDVEPGDRLVWELNEDAVTVRRELDDAGRGILATGLSAEKREEVAREMEAEIRRMRETEWNPE